MSKLEIKLTPRDQKRLLAILNGDSKRLKPKKRAKVILLKSDKKEINDISKETGLSRRTVINYTHMFLKKGMAFIQSPDKYTPSTLLKKNDLFNEFDERPPISYKEATLRIKNLYGITLSESATRRYLIKIGIYTKQKRNRFYFSFVSTRSIYL